MTMGQPTHPPGCGLNMMGRDMEVVVEEIQSIPTNSIMKNSQCMLRGRMVVVSANKSAFPGHYPGLWTEDANYVALHPATTCTDLFNPRNCGVLSPEYTFNFNYFPNN